MADAADTLRSFFRISHQVSFSCLVLLVQWRVLKFVIRSLLFYLSSFLFEFKNESLTHQCTLSEPVFLD